MRSFRGCGNKVRIGTLLRRKRKKPKIEAYDKQERRLSLEALGFRNYADYLKSDLWKSIRIKVLERDHGLCCRCGRKARQIHHSAYDIQTMRGDSIEALQSSCGACHKHAHKRGTVRMMRKTGSKAPLTQKCPVCGIPKRNPTICKKCQRSQ